MKRNYLLISGILCFFRSSYSQTIINFDATDERWVGYMNVYNLPAPNGDGSFIFGDAWGQI